MSVKNYIKVESDQDDLSHSDIDVLLTKILFEF